MAHPVEQVDEFLSTYGAMPGGEFLAMGFADLQKGVTSVPGLLLLIGGPRLRNLGLPIPKAHVCPEHMLYDLLSESDPDSAHSRYNAFIRLLVSFERAAECVKE